MLFDVNTLFYHSGSAFAFTGGEYVSLVTTATTASSVIDMGVFEDLGIGDGLYIPKVALQLSTGITCACTSLTLNFQFQGSTNSTTWTTYAESGTASTASYKAGYFVLPIDVPRRPAGAALPRYYRINMVVAGNANTESISSGNVIGGIVIQREDSYDTQALYAAGYSVS